MNTIQQAHILLVDDNTDLLRLLEEQLRGAGYQNIRTVQNCAAAQTAFAAEMPELMILDINLMGMKTVWVFISGICGKSWNRSRAGRAFCRR